MWQVGWRKAPVPRRMGSADRVEAISLICLKLDVCIGDELVGPEA